MDNVPVRYLKPEDCDRAENADRKYNSYSCMPAPGGGNECIGGGTGGQFTDCKKCLLNCSNDPAGESEDKEDVVPSEAIPFQQTTTGKVVIGGSVVVLVVLVVLLLVRMMKKKPVEPLISSFEKVMWRRK